MTGTPRPCASSTSCTTGLRCFPPSANTALRPAAHRRGAPPSSPSPNQSQSQLGCWCSWITTPSASCLCMIMIRQPSLLRRGAAAAAKPFLHRRSSWKAATDSQQAPARLICWPGSAGWLLDDGKGSFKGWFDWLPEHLRVGPWHPTAFAFLFLFYAGLIVLRPPPAFPASAVRMGEPWWWADVLVAAWSALVVASSWSKFGGAWPYVISYTGWSWVLLTARPACTALGVVLSSASSPRAGQWLLSVGSALHGPAITGAIVTFTLWNLVLFPMLLFVLPADDKKDGAAPADWTPFSSRPRFVRFNFSFFMVNVHVLNLPLAAVNVIVGAGARPLGDADLWMTFAVMGCYSLVYLGGLDRVGLHFYPMFSPRSPLCAVVYLVLFAIYYGVWCACNAVVGGA